MTPQPKNGLPSEPGIWKLIGEFPIEILDGIPFLLDYFPDHPPQKFWHPVTCRTGWQWVRPFRPGDPRIRPEPLPDADHRHADGCPHYGLWVYRFNDGSLEFRKVDNTKEIVLPGVYGRYVKYVGQPSDFVTPPAVETPVLEPCPYPGCGGEANHYGDFVQCCNPKCRAVGPNDDPDGAKWNRVARAARGAQP